MGHRSDARIKALRIKAGVRKKVFGARYEEQNSFAEPYLGF